MAAENIRREASVTEYPTQEAQRRMLEILHERLKQTYDSGQLRMRMTLQDVAALADDVGVSSEAEAVHMFSRLGEEGFFQSTGLDRPYSSGLGEWVPFAFVNVERLRGPGLMEIGELPDPGKRMMQSLDAIETAISGLENVSPEGKREARRALEELKHFLRGLPPGVAVEVGSAFARGVLGG